MFDLDTEDTQEIEVLCDQLLSMPRDRRVKEFKKLKDKNKALYRLVKEKMEEIADM